MSDLSVELNNILGLTRYDFANIDSYLKIINLQIEEGHVLQVPSWLYALEAHFCCEYGWLKGLLLTRDLLLELALKEEMIH